MEVQCHTGSMSIQIVMTYLSGSYSFGKWDCVLYESTTLYLFNISKHVISQLNLFASALKSTDTSLHCDSVWYLILFLRLYYEYNCRRVFHIFRFYFLTSTLILANQKCCHSFLLCGKDRISVPVVCGDPLLRIHFNSAAQTATMLLYHTIDGF